ncbi:MAG: Uncharacterized protein Athens041674_867 [Parcubacteria group bacterium Athens0416_74]|nr:MAG: Uncharacterized protein Athens041674_867 [Parcubacteria group bacterium Athens0416_74]
MRIIITICVLLAAGVGMIYMYARSAAPVAPPAAAVEESPTIGQVSVDTTDDTYDVLVTFDGDAFSPKELTVQKGTRVRFLNASDESVWPASAVHPTHSIYPEKDAQNCLGSSFDACRDLKKDEFFDFTFNYVGEWRYHDHVKAFKTGMVTVTE